MDLVIHDANLISVKTSNVREFLYNNVATIRSDYKYIYLWISHREYNIDYTTQVLVQKRCIDQIENHIYDIFFDNNYVEVLSEITDAYNEFQFWELCFTNIKIEEYRLCDYPNTPGKSRKDGFLFYKGVVWIEKENVEQAIIDFI
jgi:hypothetical protein